MRKKGYILEKDRAIEILLHVLFILFCVTIIYPFWTVFIDSIDNQISGGFKLFPKEFSLEAYKVVLEQKTTLFAFLNSIIRSIVGPAITVAVTFCAAYALSKRKLPFVRLMTAYVVFPMFFSGGLIPFYLQIDNLNLIDKRLSLILPFVFSGFYILVARNFMYAIPSELEESALIDGANERVILFKIILPLCLPVIATVALWSAVGMWNEWFYAMIFIQTPNKQVLQVLLRRVLVESQASALLDNPMVIVKTAEKSVRSALLIVSTVPILLAYPFAQKYFIAGLTVGAVKG